MAIKKILKDGNGNQMWPITRADCIYMTGTDNKKLTDYLTTALSGKSDSGHTHNYAASSSAGGAATSANKVNQSLKIQLNGGTTEGSSQFTFNGSAAKTVNITASSIGAAAASHGTHLTLGTGSGNAYYGDKGKVAYEHSQATHAPATAQKNSDITKSEIEAKLTGTITTHAHNYAAVSHGNHVPTVQTASNKVFLRNDNTWQTITPANIGAAATGHGHDTLNIKGENTINKTANDTTANWGAHGNSVHWYTVAGQLTNQPSQYGYILNIGKSSEVHQIWMTQSSGDMAHRGGNASGWSGSWRTILDTSNFKTHVTASAIGAAAASHGTHLTLGTGSGNAYRGDYGNAAYTHSQAAHAPTNAQKNSDITKAEIEAKLTGNITSHTHSAYAAASHGTHVGDALSSTAAKANGTAAAGTSSKVAREDHVHPLQTSVSGSSGSCTGNAATATKASQLTNARNIIIGSATKSFNGTANISYTLAEIGAMPIEPLTLDELNSIFTELGF